MKRLWIAMIAAVFCSGLLSACHTVEGAGKDIQKAGEGIEDTAKDVRTGGN